MVVKPHPAPQSSRRLKWGILIILAVVVLYTAGWFYLASFAKERARHELAEHAEKDRGTVECQTISARGFPFALYINCSDISYRDADQTLHVAASALNVGRSLLSLRTVNTQITGPAAFAMSGIDPLKADWNSLKASASINGKTAQNISLTADSLNIQRIITTEPTSNANLQLPGLQLLGLQLDLNSVEEPLQIKMTFDDLRLTGDTKLPVLPELDGVIDITSPASLASFNQRDENGSVLRGKSLQLNQALFLLPSGASISISGPASVDDQGLVNADLKIRVTNPAAIGTVLQTAFPEQARTINTIIFALGSMPKDETGAAIVPVVVRNGRASAGFIPLGRLPLF